MSLPAAEQEIDGPVVEDVETWSSCKANVRNIADIGGGAVYDIGCYVIMAPCKPLYLSLDFGSRPVAWFGNFARGRSEPGVDLLMLLTLMVNLPHAAKSLPSP